MDTKSITPTSDEAAARAEIEAVFKQGAMTSVARKSMHDRWSENMIATRIRSVQAYATAQRDDDHPEVRRPVVLLQHRGKRMQIRMDGGYLVSADHVAALRSVDGVGEVRERSW